MNKRENLTKPERIFRVAIHVRGIVQGVFFRTSVSAEAQRLELTGFVKNQHDGSVIIVAEGPKTKLKELVAWCAHGPEIAQVESHEVQWHTATRSFRNFRIQ